jgi:hypothetical protein
VSKGGEGSKQGRVVGGMRIKEGLRRRKQKKQAKRRGLPPNAYNATGISKTSQAGHQAAGPIMQYGDDT